MRKYSRAINSQVEYHEIPDMLYEHLCRYDYDYYEDPYEWRRTDYWGDPITIDPDYSIEKDFKIPDYVLIRKDIVGYVRRGYGRLPLKPLPRSRQFPLIYNKVNMESFYSESKKRSLRIDKILGEEETDFSNTLELYFPES